MQRRAVLAALGGTVVGAAGCSRRPDGVVVAGVEVINASRVPRSVAVTLGVDGTVVWSETEELPIDAQQPLECTWPRDPGEYTVTARLRRGEGRAERDLADAGSGPVGAFVVVGLRGAVAISVTDEYDRPVGFSGTCE